MLVQDSNKKSRTQRTVSVSLQGIEESLSKSNYNKYISHACFLIVFVFFNCIPDLNCDCIERFVDFNTQTRATSTATFCY